MLLVGPCKTEKKQIKRTASMEQNRMQDNEFSEEKMIS